MLVVLQDATIFETPPPQSENCSNIIIAKTILWGQLSAEEHRVENDKNIVGNDGNTVQTNGSRDDNS